MHLLSILIAPLPPFPITASPARSVCRGEGAAGGDLRHLRRRQSCAGAHARAWRVISGSGSGGSGARTLRAQRAGNRAPLVRARRGGAPRVRARGGGRAARARVLAADAGCGRCKRAQRRDKRAPGPLARRPQRRCWRRRRSSSCCCRGSINSRSSRRRSRSRNCSRNRSSPPDFGTTKTRFWSA